MDVDPMNLEIGRIADAMVRESPLPHFTFATQFRRNRVRVSALDELNRPFQGQSWRRREQQVYVFRHEDEGMQLKSSRPSIAVHRFEKKARIRLQDEKPSPRPRGERNEISPMRGESTSRLQQRTSAAEAALIAA